MNILCLISYRIDEYTVPMFRVNPVLQGVFMHYCVTESIHKHIRMIMKGSKLDADTVPDTKREPETHTANKNLAHTHSHTRKVTMGHCCFSSEMSSVLQFLEHSLFGLCEGEWNCGYRQTGEGLLTYAVWYVVSRAFIAGSPLSMIEKWKGDAVFCFHSRTNNKHVICSYPTKDVFLSEQFSVTYRLHI